MPELPDHFLEADIARTLKFNAHVTPLQREDARARLLRSAAAQTVLPPVVVAAAPERVFLREHAHSLGLWMVRVYRFMLVDFTCYERARRPPDFFQYYNVHGRGAFRIISVSA
jgi:hypothetical protein